MTTKTMIQNGLKISLNKQNELVVDMSVEQMTAVFTRQNGRKPRSKQEAASFIQVLVTRRLVEHRLFSK